VAHKTDKGISPGPEGRPPGSWRPAFRLARRALAPVERFLAIEAASALLLLGATAIALVWANSPWRESYVALWKVPLGISLGPYSFERDLHFWVNDGVMTIFFFVVGLEIRREIYRGELADARRAALPLAAALGGMLVPASLFVALNLGYATVKGWGIPMATDIAFAVGVLTLLGKRVPVALRVFLLALAVIDDVGAILVIALFYSSGVALGGLAIAGAGLALILTMQALGVRSPWSYVLPAALAWAGAYGAGIHPTLAGVVVGLMTPARAWFGRDGFVKQARESVAVLLDQGDGDESALLPHLRRLGAARREVISPVERIQHALHGWVAFGAMPLFALANAGVPLGDVPFTRESLPLLLGVGGGLLLGKPLGIVGASWLATRLGVAALPRGATWPQIGLVGVVAGIGFTMSIFIASLAFPSGTSLDTSKIGILVGSGAAAVLSYGIGRLVLRPGRPSGVGAREEERGVPAATATDPSSHHPTGEQPTGPR